MCLARPRYALYQFTSLLVGLLLLPGLLRAADIGGTTVSTNTTLTNGDTWTGGNFGINNGATVNIPTGATLTFNSTANRNLTSNTTGTLQIDTGGTFAHVTTTSGDNLVVTGAVAIVNNGTYNFASGGDLQLFNNGSSFTNNGLLLKSAGTLSGSNDPSYIYPNTATSGGSFSNSGNIQVDAGHLNIAGGSSTGGNFTTSGTGVLSFSGKWTELTGVADNSAGGSIIISNEDPVATTGGKFTAGAATTVLNVGGTGLGLGRTANAAITLDLNGNTLRNDGILFQSTSTVTTTVIGAGSFENSTTGTFRLMAGSLQLNGGNLTNHGLMAVSTGTVTIGGTAAVINSATGTFTLTSGTLTNNLTITNNGQVTFSGTHTMNGSGSFINNAQWSIAGSSTIGGTVAVSNAAGGTLTLGGGATTLTLSGNNLTNSGTAQFASTDGNVTIGGSGRFINNGTFNHGYGGGSDNLVIGNTAVFENNGTFDFQSYGDIQLTSTGVFENKGLILKSVAGANESYLYRDVTGATADIIAAAGSEIRSTAGTLHVAAGGTSHADALWTANGGNIGIAGQWTGTITGSSANGGRVRISNSGNATVASNLLIGTGGLTVNISGDGMFWDQSIINTQGNTLTNKGQFTVLGSGTKTLSGAGQLMNATGGTLTLLEGTITFADGASLRNQGLLSKITGATATSFAGTGFVINEATGSMTWTSGTISVGATVEFHNQGTVNMAGATRTLSGAGLFSNDAGGVVNWNDASTFTIAAGATFTNYGTFNAQNNANRTWSVAGSFINHGTFNHTITDNSSDNVNWTGAGQFTNHGLFNFTDNGDFGMEGGGTFTNSSTGVIRVNTTDNEHTQFFSFVGGGSGSFDNQGTIEVLGGIFRVTTAVSGSFDDLILAQNDGAGTLTGGTWIANSTATGTAQIDLDPFGNTAGITTLGQNATVELTGAGANLLQLSTLTTVNGGFYVNSKTFTQAAGLTVGATGKLGGNGIIAANVTVDGQILPGSTRGADIGKLTVSGELTFQSGSETTLFLNAPLGVASGDPDSVKAVIDALPDTDPTNQHDSIEVIGTLTLDPGMTIHVEAGPGISFGYGQYFDLFDFANLSGISTQAQADLILDLPTLGGDLEWDTSLFVSKGIIFLVPEPSRAMLMLLGVGCLVMRRRRRGV